MIVGLDLDGCLCEFNKPFGDRLRNLGAPIPSGFDTSMATDFEWPRYYGATSGEIQDAWTGVHTDETFWESLEPLDLPALSLIKESQRIHEFVAITARDGMHVEHKCLRWFHKHGISHIKVIATKDKAEAAKAANLNVMIDDWPGFLVGMPEKTDCYVVDRKYNQHFRSHHFYRVQSVYAALRHVMGR